MESLLLSVALYWSRKDPGDKVIELLERHFRQDEMVAAQKGLAELLGEPKPPERQQSVGRTATKAQAKDLQDKLVQLGNEVKLPRFVVGCDDLERVQPLLGALSVGDERGVAARLEALELSHRQGLEKMERLMAGVVRGALVPAAAPQVIVTPPAQPTFSAAAAAGGGGAGAGPQAAGGAPRARRPGPGVAQGQGQGPQGGAAGPQPPFFNRGRREGGLPAEQGQQPRQDRSCSAEKRRRVDEQGSWQEQRPYRSAGRQQRAARPKAPVVKGASAKFAELAGPVTWWVGKCRPDTTEDQVKKVLEECAVDLGVNGFAIEKVHCLTKDLNPWSKSFKVSVPAHLAEQMSKPELYPPGWESRAFTQWPSRQQQGPGGPRPREGAGPVTPQPQEGAGSTAPLEGTGPMGPLPPQEGHGLQEGPVTPGQDGSLATEQGAAGGEALQL
jgi:hypothetical protein